MGHDENGALVPAAEVSHELINNGASTLGHIHAGFTLRRRPSGVVAPNSTRAWKLGVYLGRGSALPLAQVSFAQAGIRGEVHAKGIGELGISGAGAAIANAVYNATGVRVRDYPITLDKLL